MTLDKDLVQDAMVEPTSHKPLKKRVSEHTKTDNEQVNNKK